KGAAEHGPPYRPRRGRAGTRAQEGGQPKSRCPLECRLGLEMNIIKMMCPPAAAPPRARVSRAPGVLRAVFAGANPGLRASFCRVCGFRWLALPDSPDVGGALGLRVFPLLRQDLVDPQPN